MHHITRRDFLQKTATGG
ncbi:MAG TPA: twin-arginine translocation signal domain-containing protein, partial [Bacteroidetes bacterium]|nr:twin-arginine translocation signal domain-containing protein [Bacteroidota bacterium]